VIPAVYADNLVVRRRRGNYDVIELEVLRAHHGIHARAPPVRKGHQHRNRGVPIFTYVDRLQFAEEVVDRVLPYRKEILLTLRERIADARFQPRLIEQTPESRIVEKGISGNDL
jgi:hypothetical protein